MSTKVKKCRPRDKGKNFDQGKMSTKEKCRPGKISTQNKMSTFFFREYIS